jgi:hypothetical protein
VCWIIFCVFCCDFEKWTIVSNVLPILSTTDSGSVRSRDGEKVACPALNPFSFHSNRLMELKCVTSVLTAVSFS